MLTGANNDGSNGLQQIVRYGGLAIVQDPATAEARHMPQAAIDLVEPELIYPLESIGQVLNRVVRKGRLAAEEPEVSIP